MEMEIEMKTPRPQQCDSNQPIDLHNALATLGRKTVYIEHLEAENASFRAQLGATPRNHETPGHGNMIFPSPAPSSQDGNIIPAAQHEALKLQLAALQASNSELKRQHELILKKYKESKARIKQWQAYLREKKEKEGRGRNTELASTPPPAGVFGRGTETPYTDTDVTPRASTIAHEPTMATEDNEVGPPEMPSSPPRLAAVPERPTSQSELPIRSQPVESITSSQTTVDEPNNQTDVPLPTQPAPSSDFEPIVVSSRSLKRKVGTVEGPMSPSRRIKQEPSSPSAPSNISSGDSRRPQDLRIDTTSSDDCLDNFGPAMRTPRRPKRVSDLRLRATSEEVFRPVPQLQRSASSLSDGDAGALLEQSAFLVPVTDYATRGDNGSVGSRPSKRQHVEALKPISGNVPRQQRTPKDDLKAGAKIRRTGAKDKILLVSEDGEDGSSQHATRNLQQRVTLPGLAMDDRLDELLNGPSVLRTPVLPNPIDIAAVSPRDQTRPRSAQLTTPVSVAKRTSPVKPTTSVGWTPVQAKLPQLERPTNASARNTGRGKSPPPVRPEEEPLRIRPVSTLRPEDFKINPKYMGTDFAFADTIRGRDARQNLHACTRADCCGGALEKVIRMGGTAMSGRTDAHALEAFIGPAWQALMGAKRPDEAKKLLQQAHAFCFANEHGKHRQAFERRSTPPGYWRADFPTTQEQAMDRQTAEKMKRKEVEDRHREAMREGGRWKFRDE